ncbi:hypothetical protein Tco_0527167 [Tanacetum coccineum]
MFFRGSACTSEFAKDLEAFIMNLSLSTDHEHEVLNLDSAGMRSSNAIALYSPYLLVLITGMSQSRRHVDTSLIHIESRKLPTAELFDVDLEGFSFITVNTKEYHSESSGNYLKDNGRTL